MSRLLRAEDEIYVAAREVHVIGPPMEGTGPRWPIRIALTTRAGALVIVSLTRDHAEAVADEIGRRLWSPREDGG